MGRKEPTKWTEILRLTVFVAAVGPVCWLSWLSAIALVKFFSQLATLQISDDGAILQAAANLAGAFLGALLAGAAAIAAGLIVHIREKREQRAKAHAESQRIRTLICRELQSFIIWVHFRVRTAPDEQDNSGALSGWFFISKPLPETPRLSNKELLTSTLDPESLWRFEQIETSLRFLREFIRNLPHDILNQSLQQQVWGNIDHLRKQAADALDRDGGEMFRVNALQAKDDNIFAQEPPLVPLRGRPVDRKDVDAWEARMNLIAKTYHQSRAVG
jgi:hypothetical protein